MKTDEQLEQILRATFAARSATVTAGPAWRAGASTEPDADGRGEVLDLAPRRPRHRFAPLAAAAVVALAVVGLVVGVRAATERPTRPAAPDIAMRTTAPPTSPAAPVAHRAACDASLPSGWRDAIAAHTTTFASRTYGQVSIQGVTDDGTVVVEYAPPGTSVRGTITLNFGTLSPGSDRIRPLTTIAGHGDSVGWSFQLQGNTLLVGTHFTRGQGPTSATPTRITAIDVHEGEQIAVANLPGSDASDTDGAFLQDGVVYWDEYPADSNNREIVYAYDVATGVRSTLYDGPRADRDLGRSAAGIWWTGSPLAPNRPARLPEAVAENSRNKAARQSLTTDGTSYAWRTANTISWWTPGSAVVKTRINNDGVEAVAGPILAFSPAGNRVPELLDTRTGAVIRLPGGDSNIVNFAYTNSALQIATYPRFSEPSSITRMIRLDAASLTEARC